MTQQEQIYLKGFMDKCASVGVDGDALIKEALSTELLAKTLPYIRMRLGGQLMGTMAKGLEDGAAPGSSVAKMIDNLTQRAARADRYSHKVMSRPGGTEQMAANELKAMLDGIQGWAEQG